MVPVAPVINGVAFVFEFQVRCVSILKCLYLNIFADFLPHLCLPKLQCLLTDFFFTGYHVRFVVWDGSVRVYLFIPSFVYLL